MPWIKGEQNFGAEVLEQKKHLEKREIRELKRSNVEPTTDTESLRQKCAHC